MTRLLVTGGGGAGVPMLWEFWHKRYEVHFADCDPLAFSPEIPAARCHVIPKGGAPDFERSLLDLCRSLGIDLLIPQVDEELPIMSAIRRAGYDVLLPDEWYVHTMLDKLGSMRELGARGIPVPRTVIGKPRWGRGSRDLMVEQECLEGQEYTVQAVADSRKVLRCIVPVLVKAKRGITIRGRTDYRLPVMDACRHIHDVLPFAGCVNVQGMLTDSGFRPFEINPRFSTTTGLALAVGVDPVAIWLGRDVGSWPQRSVTLRRTWQNHLAYS